VKIRGYRIELGEVESVLQGCTGVGQCVVTAEADNQGSRRLAGYVVGVQGYDRSKVMEELRARLPEYMVPVVLIEIEKMPLTANGKIDKRSLPPVDISSFKKDYVAPQNSTEEALVRIWQEVLGAEIIGINENFFQVGGHSLKAMQVISRIHKILETVLTLQDLFMKPTIIELAIEINNREKVKYKPIEKIPEKPYYEISNAQKRIWVHCNLDNAGISYNMPYAFVVEGSLNIPALEKSMEALLERHESLRTTFIIVDGAPKQKINTREELAFRFDIINIENDGEKEAESKLLADQEAATPFELEGECLIRFKVIRLSSKKHVLLLTVHHIICDGWSSRVMIDDLTKFYQAFGKNKLPNIPRLRIQYKDYTHWQLNNVKAMDAESYLDSLRGRLQKINLPYDNLDLNQIGFRGQTRILDLTPEYTTALWNISKALNTNISNVLLGVYIVFLHKLSNQRMISLGIGHSNRTNPDLEKLIGFFVNVLVITVDIEEDTTFQELVRKASSSLSKALQYSDYPFDMLVNNVKVQREEHMPLNVMFDYATYEDVLINASEEALITNDVVNEEQIYGMEIKFPAAKFDLTLFAANSGPDIHMRLEYNADLFSRGTIDKLQDFMLHIIEKILDD
jgi:hypothetical protein